MSEGIQQINGRDYAKSYVSGEYKVIVRVLAADDERRQIAI